MKLIYVFLSMQKSNEYTQNQVNSWSPNINMLGQLFVLVVVFFIVIALAYYTTRFIGAAKYRNKNSSLKIIDSIGVGYQSMLQIIEVGDKIILIGVTKERINFICEVNKDSINSNINDSKLEVPNSFQKYFNNFLNKKNDEETKR